MSGVWVGVDPGPSYTGVVVRSGRVLLWHRVVTNQPRVDAGLRAGKQDHGVGPDYLDAVMAAADAAAAVAAEHAPSPSFALEGAVAPGGFNAGKKEFARPKDVLGLGIVLGFVLARLPGAVLVRPRGHGAELLAGYPEDLVTAGERRAGVNRSAKSATSLLRHCRSAWDVTLSAEQQSRRGVLL